MPTTARDNYRKRQNRKTRRDIQLRKEHPTIENWTIVIYEREICLMGNIYNDARFSDGHPIRTSRLKYIDHLLSMTQTRKYVLGVPSQEYLEYRKMNNLGPITQVRHYFS